MGEQEKLEKRIKELEEQVQTLKHTLGSQAKDISEEDNSTDFSRRDFLKTLGLGAAGLSAISMLPSAAALDIRDDNIEFYGGPDETNIEFAVDEDGNVTVPTGDLTVQGNTVWHQGNDGPGSGLNADLVDGYEPPFGVDALDGADGSNGEFLQTDGTNVQWTDASATARDIARNAQGQVQFQQAGTASATATQTGTPVTAQVQGSGKVMFDRLQVSFQSTTVYDAQGNSLGVGTADGIAYLKRNGVTEVSGTPPLTATESPSTESPTWTAEANFTRLAGWNASTATAQGDILLSPSASASGGVLNQRGHFNRMIATASITGTTHPSARVSLLIEGNTVSQTTGTIPGIFPVSGSDTPLTSFPGVIDVSLNIHNETTLVRTTTFNVDLTLEGIATFGEGPGNVKMTASKNDTVSVE